MIPLNLLIFGFILPAAIFAIPASFVWQPWNRHSTGIRAPWLSPLGFGLGYLTGHAGLQGIPSFPPVESLQWLLVLVLAATLWFVVEMIAKTAPLIQWSSRTVFSGLLAYLLLQSMFKYSWNATEGIVWLASIGMATIAFMFIASRFAESSSGFYVPLVWSIFAGGSSGIFIISGSALLGHLGGILAIMMGVGFLIALLKPSFALTRGTMTIFPLVFMGLVLNAYFYADMPAMSTVLVLIAPAAALVISQIPAVNHRPVVVKAAGVAIIIIFIAIALFFAVKASPPLEYGY